MKHLARYTIFRFILVGLLSTSIYFCVAMFIVEILEQSLLIGSYSAFCISLIISYFLHSEWSFKVKCNFRRFIRFTLVAMLNLEVLMGISIFAELFKVSNFNSVLVTCTLIPLTSYLLNKIWVFR